MSLKLENDDVTKVMLGDQVVSSVYKGTDQVWTAEEPVVIEPIDEITQVFRPWPYTGNSAEQKITTGTDTLTNGGLVWIKRRDSGLGHYLFDTVRGERNAISSHDTSAQATYPQSMEYFDTDGFGLKGTDGAFNRDNANFMSWSFQRRPGFMDIVEYEGNGVQNREVKHSLGCQPGIVITKSIDKNRGWIVWHKDINSAWTGGTTEGDNSGGNQTGRLELDKPDAFFAGYGGYTYVNEKAFGVYHNNSDTNVAGEKYIAYVFADGALDDSIIKCGTYTGNSNSDQIVDVGFEAQYLLVKSIGSGYWAIVDQERGMPQNTTPTLRANESLQEVAGTEVNIANDPLGFRVLGGKFNNNNEKYIYMAIKAPPPPPPGPWGTEALSGKRECYFELDKAGVTFPTDNFTVETWFKSFGGPNHGSYASIFGAWSHPPANGWMVGYNMNLNDGTQDISVMHGMHNDTYEYSKITTNPMTDWTHFAMVKTGGQLIFYVNGTKVKTVSAGSYTWGGHTQFYCGASGIRDAAYGTYSNFRVSNIVRYSVPFNPPTTHFEPDANTLVLAHQGPEFKDYSGNNVNMVAGAGCKITQDSPWSARDTYSEVANAQRKVAAVKEAVVGKVKNSKDIKDDE